MTDKQKKALKILNELWYVSHNDGLAKLKDEDYYLLVECILDNDNDYPTGKEWKDADEHPINYDGKAMLHVLNKGHEQGYKDAIDKAREWLEGNVLGSREFFERFRKAMEENK